MSTNHIKKNKKMNKQKRMTKTKRNRKSKNRKNIKYISKKVMKGGSICDLFTASAATSAATSKTSIPIVKSTKSNSSVTPCISLELNSNFFIVGADLIVNGANSQLQLGGGTAGAIARADNGAVQKECNEYISLNGDVPTGSSMITCGPSNYPAIKYIAHAVAPKGTPTDETIKQMKSVVKDILEKAALKENVNKIAIPPIGTGIFGFDFETAVKIYFEETIDFIIKGKTGNLKEICFVDITKNVKDKYQNDIWNTEFAKIHPQFKCKK